MVKGCPFLPTLVWRNSTGPGDVTATSSDTTANTGIISTSAAEGGNAVESALDRLATAVELRLLQGG